MLKLFSCTTRQLVLDLKDFKSMTFLKRYVHLYQTKSKTPSQKINSLYSLCLKNRANLFVNLSAIIDLTNVTTSLSKDDFLKLFRLLLFLKLKVRNEFYRYINKKSLSLLSVKLLKDINDLTVYEILIFTNIFYRLNIKLPSEDCIRLSQYFISHINNITLENLIDFIKFFRLGPFQEDILLSLQDKLINEIDKLNFTQVPHVLAGLSTYAYYQPEFCEKLFKRGFSLLNTNEDIRCKDFARFVWCLAMLNYSIDDKFIHIIINTVKQLRSQFFTFHAKLIDCLKSLAVLGIYEKSVFELYLNDDHLIKLLENINMFKVPNDLNFILKSIEIESSEINITLYDKIRLLSRSADTDNLDQINQSERSQLFSSLINCLSDAVVVYPLSHISISSIYYNDCIYEVLDETVLLRSSIKKYGGYFNCKLRQMEKKGLTFKLISSKEDIKNGSL